MESTKVIVSRYWNNPSIQVSVTAADISVSVGLQDFVSALLTELPHPMLVNTRGALASEMQAAVSSVLNKLKEASVHAGT